MWLEDFDYAFAEFIVTATAYRDAKDAHAAMLVSKDEAEAASAAAVANVAACNTALIAANNALTTVIAGTPIFDVPTSAAIFAARDALRNAQINLQDAVETSLSAEAAVQDCDFQLIQLEANVASADATFQQAKAALEEVLSRTIGGN